ncbi:MAG TPA: ABC transporter permease [Humisphaera sp.]
MSTTSLDSPTADAASRGGDAPPAAAVDARPAAAAGPRPFRVIRPNSGWSALNVAEIWRFRDLFLTMAARDMRVRYRQTFLGAIWVVLQPMMAAGVFTFLFGVLARMPRPDERIPFFLFSFVGLTGWGVFSGTLGRASGSLVGNAHLISKVAFPRMVLPLATVAGTLVDLLVSLAVIAGMLAFYGINPGPGALMLPVWVLILTVAGMGLGLLAAALTVTWRDVGYVQPAVTQFLMYASPVVYTAAAVEQSGAQAAARAAFHLNPMVPALEGLRCAVLGPTAGSVSAGGVAYAAVSGVAVFALGAAVFARAERRFADVI